MCSFYPFQDTPADLDVYVDTDFAGCSNSRRSTSGGVALYGGCNVKHWSKTQTTVALSSGEAELHGIAAGMAQGLGLQALARDLGFEVTPLYIPMPLPPLGLLGGVAWATHDIWIAQTYGSKRRYCRNSLG